MASNLDMAIAMRRLHWSHPAYATAVTGSRPPCAPDHPWARIPARDLIRGVCPVCMGALDGEKAARTLRALCLIGKRDD